MAKAMTNEVKNTPNVKGFFSWDDFKDFNQKIKDFLDKPNSENANKILSVIEDTIGFQSSDGVDRYDVLMLKQNLDAMTLMGFDDKTNALYQENFATLSGIASEFLSKHTLPFIEKTGIGKMTDSVVLAVREQINKFVEEPTQKNASTILDTYRMSIGEISAIDGVRNYSFLVMQDRLKKIIGRVDNKISEEPECYKTSDKDELNQLLDKAVKYYGAPKAPKP